MSRKLKIGLKSCSSEQGFAIPVTMALGFFMLLIGVTMIMRAQGDQVTASAQKGAAQSLAVTEGGVTRSLSTLNQFNHGFLLKLNYDPINPATNKTYLGPDGILNNGDGETTAVDQWSNPPSSGGCASTSGSLPGGLTSGAMGSGNYQIKAYRYRDPDSTPNTGDEIGTLLVEGKQQSAVSQVQVSIGIVHSPRAGSFAGLYASNIINLGNNDIRNPPSTTGSASAANVICKNCTVPSAQCSASGPTPAGLNSAVGRGPNSDIDGTIFISDPQLPPVPTAPTTACSSTSGATCSINIGSIDTMTLPRTADVTARTTWGTAPSAPYHYVISNINLSGNNNIIINTTTAPVYLYVSGNVSLSGTGGIAHTGSPERLRLYGKPADANSSNDQSITISGGSSASHIFIYAPDAIVGINGGSNTPDIYGAVWAKTWNGSSSSNASSSDTADIQVPVNMPTLLGGTFSDVGMQNYGSSAPSSWQRQQVATQ